MHDIRDYYYQIVKIVVGFPYRDLRLFFPIPLCSLPRRQFQHSIFIFLNYNGPFLFTKINFTANNAP